MPSRRVSLSEALRRAIVASDENTMEIERATGVSNTMLSRFLRGERGLSLSTADKLARHLGLDLVKRKRRKK